MAERDAGEKLFLSSSLKSVLNGFIDSINYYCALIYRFYIGRKFRFLFKTKEKTEKITTRNTSSNMKLESVDAMFIINEVETAEYHMRKSHKIRDLKKLKDPLQTMY